MVCPRCASEQFTVIRTYRSKTTSGKYSADCDVRIQMCDECSLKIKVQCALDKISVYNPQLMREEFVDKIEYVTTHLKHQNRVPQQGLFDE